MAELKQIIINEYIDGFDDNLKGIMFFPTYSKCFSDYELLTNRWNDKAELLQKISSKLQDNDIDWHKLYSNDAEAKEIQYLKITNIDKQPIFNFVSNTDIKNQPLFKEIEEYRDLRGLLFKDFHFSERRMFHQTSFDYCIIENCTFENMTFLGSDFNHMWFFDSEFINCYFECNIYSTIFISCKFSNSKFIHVYKNQQLAKIVFFICKLERVSININPKEFAFISCGKMCLINHDYSTVGFNNAGSKILNEFKPRLSKESYKRLSKDVYSDFKLYFIEMNKVFTENYSHEKFLESYYAYKLFDDYSQNNYQTKISYLFGRYIFAYGLKCRQPLIVLGTLSVISSLVFLFGGITYDNVYINRDFIFNISEASGTFKDFVTCWYLSICSSLNIGINFGVNTLWINLFKSVLSFMGFILMTIFTFNLARKYIR